MKPLLVLLLVPFGITAADVVSVVATPTQISINMLRPVKSIDTPNALAYVIQPAPARRLVEVIFDVNVVVGGIDLVNLRCTDAAGGQAPLDLETGQPLCDIPALADGKTRDITIQLPGVLFGGTTKPVDISTSASYTKPQFAPLQPKVVSGGRELYIGVEPSIRAQLLSDLATHQGQMKVTLKFDPNDTTPDYDLRVTGVKASGRDEPVPGNLQGDYIKISLSGLLPSRPLEYQIVLAINKTALSAGIQQRTDPDATELTIIGTVAASSTPDREHADFYLDATFTSYVDPFDESKPKSPSNNGERRNVGIFGLTYAPTAKQWNFGLTGTGGVSWVALRPYLTADVSTLPLKEADVPTQITEGFDLAYGFNRRDNTGLRGIVFTAGGKHESDRDLQFQMAVGRFTATPVVKGLAQSRAYRDRLAANHNKTFPVTAYSFRPRVGYEIGDVVRDRPERLIQNVNFQDYISRFLIQFDMAVEFRRNVTLSASDVYYYHWQVDRRPHRNYLEAKLDLNAGYLFPRFGGRGLSYGIVGKFQRGEQSPSFRPVNVFSIGVTFVH